MIEDHDIKSLQAENDELLEKVGELEGRISELEDEVAELEGAECEECLRLEAELEERDAAEDIVDALMEVRRFVHRKQYQEAIDYADRFLPYEARYAS